VLEHHPVRDASTVTTQRMIRVELRRLPTTMLIEQGVELDPNRFEQA